jgi:hypothetical protein
MMRGVFASAALLLAARCAPFDAVSEASDSGTSDSSGGDSGASDGGGAADGTDAGAVVFVQEASNTGSGAATLTVTLTKAPADGHSLVLVVGSNGDYPSGVSGGGVRSWSNPAMSGLHVSTSIWVGLAVSNASPTVTITWQTAPPRAGALLTEWAGLSAVDSAGTSNKDMTPTSTVIVTPFAAQPGQLLFAAAGTQAPATAGPTGGFSPLGPVLVASSFDLLAAYLKVGATGPYGTSWTISTAIGWDTILVALH